MSRLIVRQTFKNMFIDMIIYNEGFELRNIYNQPIFIAAGENTPEERKTLEVGETAMFNCKNFRKINIEIRSLDNIPLDRIKINLNNKKTVKDLLRFKKKGDLKNAKFHL